MSDTLIPLASAISVGSAVAGALTLAVIALWRKVTHIETKLGDCEERWRREVKRGAELFAKASMTAPRADPALPPPPEWEEQTGVRNLRAELERESVLREYLESTPPGPRIPRPKMPSRPR